MKKIIFLLSSLAFLFVSLPVFSQQDDDSIKRIEIGQLSTTHVLFTSDLTYVDIASPQFIVAKVVQASKNMLALSAREPFAFETTISALEANGTMHTFYVTYAEKPSQLIIDTRVRRKTSTGQVNTQIRPKETDVSQIAQQDENVDSVSVSSIDKPNKEKKANKAKKKKRPSREKHTGIVPEVSTGINVTSDVTSNFGRQNAPTIEEVMNLDRDIYHVFDKLYRISVMVTNIYAYSDFTYIVLELVNNSDIGYQSGDVQFNIENRRNSTKSLASDQPVSPKSSYGTLSCPPKSSTRIGYTIPKQTLLKNQVLKLYIYEKGGTRNLFLTLSDKDLNLAASPFISYNQ